MLLCKIFTRLTTSAILITPLLYFSILLVIFRILGIAKALLRFLISMRVYCFSFHSAFIENFQDCITSMKIQGLVSNYKKQRGISHTTVWWNNCSAFVLLFLGASLSFSFQFHSSIIFSMENNLFINNFHHLFHKGGEIIHPPRKGGGKSCIENYRPVSFTQDGNLG